MRTFWNTKGGLHTINEWEPNCWMQVTCPTEEDRKMLEEQYEIPDYFLSDISDTDERARYEYDDGWMLIILRIPYVKEVRSRTPYTTVPLGIINKRDVTITICYYETNMMIDFVSYQQRRGEGFVDYVDMIFRMFLSSAVWYLKRLKQINLIIDKAKRDIDADLIEDVNIEMSQARETARIYSEILDSTMETYRGIINNNMNTVMRTLTSVSIILMFPTLISSLFGMNLINGMEEKFWGFPIALAISIVVSVGSWAFLRSKKLL